MKFIYDSLFKALISVTKEMLQKIIEHNCEQKESWAQGQSTWAPDQLLKQMCDIGVI